MRGEVKVQDAAQLLAGDIILFFSDTSLADKTLTVLDYIRFPTFGRHNITHVAICTGYEDNKPMLAHVAWEGKRYRKDVLHHIFEISPDNDRAFFVFRATNPLVAEQIANLAIKEKNRHLKWDMFTGIKSFFSHPELDKNRKLPQKKKISQSSICSKFVIQCIKKAALQTDWKYYPAIRSNILPMALEYYLDQQEELYEKSFYPGRRI